MAISAETLQLLVDAGLEGDNLMRVVRSIAADNPEKKRSANAIRQARYRDKNRDRDVTNDVTDNVTSNATESVTPRVHVEDNLQTKELTGQSRKKTSREEQAEFEAELSALLDPVRVQALVDVRKKKGGKLNAHSASLLIAKIHQCGLTPTEAADMMALRFWISIEPEWVQRTTPRSGAPPNGRMSAVETNFARRMRKDEPGSGRRDNGDAELLPPDKPELRNLIRDVGQAMRIPDGSGHH